MPSKTKIGDSFTKLLDASSRPIYAVDAQRQIVYGNAALARWLGLDKSQIIGREVEYHSEPAAEVSSSASGSGPLTALCPPPTAFASEPCTGTLACLARDGRLLHRRAEFIPLETRARSGPTSETKASAAAPRVSVLVVLGTAEMLPHELASGLSGDPTADELHRAIRRFRRAQATHYAAPSLLGDSPAIQKARAQSRGRSRQRGQCADPRPTGKRPRACRAGRSLHFRRRQQREINTDRLPTAQRRPIAADARLAPRWTR